MSEELGITVKKDEDISEWYQQVVLKAKLADYSPVKGTIIIRWQGMAVWEAIRNFWDPAMKEHGVENHYFPLFIPESLLKREAEHFEGFTPEVAWVTMAGETPLDERLAIRPTSETIMYEMFSKWVKSYRDLPLRVNQWCNVVRWETKMTKPFLRGREFLWHEGHTAHETREEAEEEMRWAIEWYRRISEELLAVPVVVGRKTESDKFAGADITMAIEALMPDGKALQMGTSHLLGQNFSKPFEIRFLGRDEKNHFVWQTSWGISTRMLGGMVLLHGDDRGMVFPPRVAPIQAVIIPIGFEKVPEVLEKARELKALLEGEGLRIRLDERKEYTPGFKFNEWELMGVPLRIELGPRDLKEGKMVLVRRNSGEKSSAEFSDTGAVKDALEGIQQDLLNSARELMKERTAEVEELEELKEVLEERKWAIINHCGREECEREIEAKVTGGPRVIPEEGGEPSGGCIGCGKKAAYRVYWARSY